MQKELTAEEVDRIVEGQLKRLEEEYDMVHQFNVLPTENPLSNPEISEMLKKEFPQNQINSLINNDLNDYKLTVKYDAAPLNAPQGDSSNPHKQGEIKDEDGEQDEIEDNPYQMMDNNEDDNQLFSDEEEGSKEGEGVEDRMGECEDEGNVVGGEQEKVGEEYRPEEREIDCARIMEIASKMNISCPEWMKNSDECEKRIRQLFK